MTRASDFGVLEVELIVRTEHVVHLTDLVPRRTNLAFTGRITRSLLDELAAIAGGVLGWSEATREAEIDATMLLLAERHGVHLEIARPTATASIG